MSILNIYLTWILESYHASNGNCFLFVELLVGGLIIMKISTIDFTHSDNLIIGYGIRGIRLWIGIMVESVMISHATTTLSPCMRHLIQH